MNKYRVCGVYSPEPRSEVYCLRLNFNISKLVYLLLRKHRHAKRARVIFLVIGVFVELFIVMIWLSFFGVAMYSKKETGNL